MSVTDILRKEAHELMNASVTDLENKERIRLCIDGDMEGYLQTFKLKNQNLMATVEMTEAKYQEMKNNYEETSKRLEDLSLVLEQTIRTLAVTEKQLDNVVKGLQEECTKTKMYEEMLGKIKGAMCL